MSAVAVKGSFVVTRDDTFVLMIKSEEVDGLLLVCESGRSESRKPWLSPTYTSHYLNQIYTLDG